MKAIRTIRNDPRAWLRDAFPICKWLPKYKIWDIPYDLVAGITVGLTLLPVSLAYAQMAYLRPECGLYSSFIGQIVYIFIGTSKDAIIGPSAIGSMLLAEFNVQNPLYIIGDNTYAAILAMTNGIILILIGIFKFGFVVNLFSIPVVSGFTSASAFAISASQLKTLLGIQKTPHASPGVFVKQIKSIFDQKDEIRQLDVIFGVSSLVFLLMVEYIHISFVELMKNCNKPITARAKRLRESWLNYLRLIVASRNVAVFIASTGTAYYLYSQNPDEMKDRLTVVGYIKPGFPVPKFPQFEITNVTRVLVEHGNSSEWVEENVVVQSTKDVLLTLSIGFVIMPLMAIMELFAILKALGRKNGYRIDATQELVAVGLGNFLQSLIGAYPVTAATAKCCLNDQCGVRSVLSTLFSVILVLVSISCLTDVFFYVPKAALAAILIAAAHHLFDYKAAVHIWREYKPDFVLFMLTFLLCLFFDLAYGILIAILLNMLTFLHPVVKVQLSVSKEPLEKITHFSHNLGEENVLVTVVQLSHGMKYPSVDKFIDKMAHIFATHGVHFVLDCRFVTGFDFTGLQAWHMLLRMAFHHNKHIIFTNLPEHVRKQLESIGLENFRHVSDVEMAISEFSAAVAMAKSGAESHDMAVVRRLRHTISVVSGNSSSELRFEQMPRTDTLPDMTLQHHPSPRLHRHDEFTENASTEDIKTQEARLLKLLEPTAPNFYNLPMAVGSVSDDIEQVEDEESASSVGQALAGDHNIQFHGHPFHVAKRNTDFSTHRMYLIEETDGLIYSDEQNAESGSKNRRKNLETEELITKDSATQT